MLPAASALHSRSIIAMHAARQKMRIYDSGNRSSDAPDADATCDQLSRLAKELAAVLQAKSDAEASFQGTLAQFEGALQEALIEVKRLQAPARRDPEPRPPGTVNQRMLDLFHRDPQTMHLSQRDWAAHLNCCPAAVAKAPAWQVIRTARALERSERLEARGSRREGGAV